MKFQKGKSGNPGGRPKENGELKQLAREHAPAAIARLVDWMQSDNPKASVQAAVALLDRGYGRPTVAIAGEDGSPLKSVNEIVLRGVRAGERLDDERLIVPVNDVASGARKEH